MIATLLIIAALLVWLGIERNRHTDTRERLAQARARVTVIEQEQRETRHSLATALAAVWTDEPSVTTVFDKYLDALAPADAMAVRVCGGRKSGVA